MLEIGLLLFLGRGQVRDFAALHHSRTAGLRADRAHRDHQSGPRRVLLQFPIGRVQRLPDPVQVGLSVGQTARLRSRLGRNPNGCQEQHRDRAGGNRRPSDELLHPPIILQVLTCRTQSTSQEIDASDNGVGKGALPRARRNSTSGGATRNSITHLNAGTVTSRQTGLRNMKVEKLIPIG